MSRKHVTMLVWSNYTTWKLTQTFSNDDEGLDKIHVYIYYDNAGIWVTSNWGILIVNFLIVNLLAPESDISANRDLPMGSE